MLKNYICINGKKLKLTDEQIRQLDVAPPKPTESDIARMARKSKAGEAKNYYSVHDTITIDGIKFEIVGIGHDIDAATGRRNTITLRQVDHLKKSTIDNPASCPPGFATSELDKSLVESPESWIPESVVPYMRTVLKEYVTYDGIIKIMQRKLWLFSESEMFGSAIYAPAEDGKRYEAFATRKDRMVFRENGSTSFWLRSKAVDSGTFCMIDEFGGAGYNPANHPYGVALGFCI